MNQKNVFLNIVVLTGLLTAASQYSFSQGITFAHDLDSVLAVAKSEKKPIFIDFYTSWCGPCKVLDKEVFIKENVGDFYNSQFISCKIQCDDNGKGVEIGKKYQVYAYPTLMYLNENGEILHSMAGTLSPEEFIELGKIALNPEKNLLSLLTKWNNGQRDTAFVSLYFKELKTAYRAELAKSQFQQYLNELGEKEKTTEHTFNIIKLIGFPPFSEVFSFVESHKSQFGKQVGKPVVEDYLAKSYTWYLKNMVLTKGSIARKEYFDAKAKFKAKKYASYKEVSMFLEIHETFDTTLKVDIKEYQRRGTEFLNQYGDKYDSYTLALSSLLGNCTGKENEGAEGIKWMENLIARNPDPKYYNTYFYILWRNYQYDKAIAVGEQMREMAIKSNQPTKDIDGQIAQVTEYKEKYLKKKQAAAAN